jgi:hypothetical protein
MEARVQTTATHEWRVVFLRAVHDGLAVFHAYFAGAIACASIRCVKIMQFITTYV